MSTTEQEAPAGALSSGSARAAEFAPAPEPAPASTSQAARRSGHRTTRVLSVLSVAGALAATSAVLVTAAQPSAAGPIEKVTADAWETTAALSDALRGLRPGATRNPAGVLAKRAAGAVDGAGRRVEALELPVSDTPLRARVLATLRADAAWIDAVGSTLANPPSPRRADLPGLAKRAATGAALVAVDDERADGTVGGTGRLLSATNDSLQPGPAGVRIER